MCEMNCKSKVLYFLLISAFMVLTLAFSVNSVLAEKKYKLVYGVGYPPVINSSKAAMFFKEKAEEYSNGRLEIKVYDSNKVCSEGSCIEQIKLGDVDICEISAANYSAFSSLFDVILMPYLIPPTYEANRRFAFSPIAEKLEKSSEKKDKIKCLGIVTGCGFRVLGCNEPIRVPADLKGKKIRATIGGVNMNLIRAWGGVSINIPYSEFYTSLQTKIITGWFAGDGWNWHQNFYEVIKYSTDMRAQFQFHLRFMNVDKYNSLPMDLQKVIDKVAKETKVAQWDTDYYDVEMGRAEMEKKGWKLIRPTYAEMELWKEPVKNLHNTIFKDKIDHEIYKEIKKYFEPPF